MYENYLNINTKYNNIYSLYVFQTIFKNFRAFSRKISAKQFAVQKCKGFSFEK